MAIYHQDIADIELNSGSLHRSFLGHSIGLGDAAANRFGVRVFRDGVAETLSGVTCQGFFRNANGENIALTSYGTIDGNVAYVTLPQACYNVEGMFTLAIKLVGGGVTGTMRIIDGMVDNTNTGSAVAPTGSVPTYQEVLSVYEQMQAAVTNYDAKVAEQDGKISDLKSAFTHAVPFYEVSNNAVGYVWIENHYPSGTILTWENTGSTSNILIGHYESDKTTRIGANTTITPGSKTNITIPSGNVAYIAVYFYGAGSASYHSQDGVYSTVRYDMEQGLTSGQKMQARTNIDAASNTEYQATKAIAESIHEEIPYYAYSSGSTGYIWIDNPYTAGIVLTWENTGTTNNILIGHYKSDKSTRIGANTVIEPGKKADVTIPAGSVAYIAIYFYGAGSASYHTQSGIYEYVQAVESQINAAIEQTNDNIKSIAYNCNMLDDAEVLTNKNLNYDTGAITDGGSKTLYKITVEPSGSYYISQLSGVYMYICLYDANMTFIDNMYHYHGNRGAWNAEWSVPSNCTYVVAWVDSAYTDTAFWGDQKDYSTFGLGYKKVLSNDIYADTGNSNESFVVIGSGTDADFASVKEGFAFAVANGLKAIIQPGVYDLIEEGATGEGLVLPKEVWGYGATLVCKPSTKNWTISAVNVDKNGTGTKIYGLRIECENCRYCIHDEMGYSTTDYYHNVFKDLTLIHESEPDETLIYPQAIGGGLGDGGFVEIENVVCDTAAQRCISYHSYAHNDGQGQPIPQTKPCTIIIKDSYFSGNVHGTSSGTWTTVKNTMYVSNCSIGDAISYGEGYNMIVKGWNNVQR